MISLYLFVSLLPLYILADPSDSPFAARPLRIRLVNYEKRYQVRHAPTPPEVSGSSNSNGPSIELSEDAPSTVVSSQSYLHSIRKRIRGTKLHTVSTALSHLSSSEPLEGMREVDGSNENSLNSPEKAVRKLFHNTTTPQALKTTTTTTEKTPEKVEIRENATNSGSTGKTRAQLNRDSLPVEKTQNLSEIIQEPIKTNQSMTAMTELDVKSDEMLQKTFRRTTLAMTDYKATTPASSGLRTLPTVSNPPVSSSKAPIFTLPPLFAAPNLALADPPAQTRQPLVQLPTGGQGGNGGPPVQHITPQFDTPSNLSPRQIPTNVQPQPQPNQLGQPNQPPPLQPGLGQGPPQNGRPNPAPGQSTTPSRPDLEQLGCGFDLLSQTCKDVFGLGWCGQCTDLGNVFLHDCKCAAPTELGRTASSLFTQPPTTTPYNALGQQPILQQQLQAQQNALANAQQLQAGQLQGQLQGPQQISTTQHLVQQPSPNQFPQQFAQQQQQQQLPQQPVIPSIPQPQALQGFVQQPTWSL